MWRPHHLMCASPEDVFFGLNMVSNVTHRRFTIRIKWFDGFKVSKVLDFNVLRVYIS